MKALAHKTGLIFDIFFAVVFMPLLLLVGPARFWLGSYTLFFFIAVAYLYGCYFVIKRFELPKLILLKEYRKLGMIAAGFLAATWLVSLYPLPDLDFAIPSMSEYQTAVRNYNVSVSLWFMFSAVVLYSLTVAFVKELYERMLLQNIAENQRNKAQLAMLKAQISPHFLFNTLNSIYSMIVGTSPKAEDAMVKFSEMLKYTYVTSDSEQVALRDEIDCINNYIDLQKLRFGAHTEVEFRCEVADELTLVPPMIFLTFVENAFKYGASTSKPCHILISLQLSDGELKFQTQNRVMRYKDGFRAEMPVGIQNCRNRLEALYSGKFSLESAEENSEFSLSLKLSLK